MQHPHKHNLGMMHTQAERLEGKCLSDFYKNAGTKLLWQCARGHTWEAIPANVMRGHWCPVCAGRGKTIEDMRLVARDRGGECLSQTYVNNRTKLTWRCAKGHRWDAIPNSIRRGSWCPTCAGRYRTIATMIALAKERGGTCLSSRFVGVFGKLRWRCAEAHEWDATPVTIESGSWCQQCSRGLGERIAQQFFEQLFGSPFPNVKPQWLVNSAGARMELDGYSDALHIAFEHQGEHHYTTRAHYARSDSRLQRRITDDAVKSRLCAEHGIALIVLPEIPARLPVESIRSVIRTQCIQKGVVLPAGFDDAPVDLSKAYATTRTQEAMRDLQVIAEQRGGRCLSPCYIDAYEKMEWQCKSGHHWTAHAHNIKSGKWCPFCIGRGKAISNMRDFAQGKGGQCLSAHYSGGKRKLTWRCRKGHIWTATAEKVVTSGRWCPVCGGRQRLTIQQMHALAKERGGFCLSAEYRNARSKLVWQCAHGHTWEAVPYHVKTGTWCPICAGRRPGNQNKAPNKSVDHYVSPGADAG
jgi:hypothetical protein